MFPKGSRTCPAFPADASTAALFRLLLAYAVLLEYYVSGYELEYIRSGDYITGAPRASFQRVGRLIW
ncbi:hypothetical protein A1h_00028 [Klebsiella phage VLCpiA1h]|nr:hypothetical protein A1h_00028 [Klebsiella phage VLCpiA1h]